MESGYCATKRLPDGWVEIRLYDAADTLEAVMRLRPTYHCLYVAHLLAAQSEVLEQEAGPWPSVEPIPFPVRQLTG
jgi:hypothetical protein